MDNDITHWIEKLADGDEFAAQKIWEFSYEKLLRVARKKLGNGNRRMADEEDVVLSAFHSFCRGAAAGRFAQLADQDDMWKLLLTITARKVTAQMRYAVRQKRGGGAVRGESVFAHDGLSGKNQGISQAQDQQATPEFAAMLAEQCEQLLSSLSDSSLQKVALLKLEGYTNNEIADKLQCSPGTIGRKLSRIRKYWNRRA